MAARLASPTPAPGLDHRDVPAAVLRAIERFQWDFATFKVDFALDGPIPWLHSETARAGTVHIAEGIDALTRAMSSIGVLARAAAHAARHFSGRP